MNPSFWISLVALTVSIGALLHSISTNRSQVKISLTAKRSRIRLDVHEASLRLIGLIRKIMREPQTDQLIHILDTLTETADGLVSVYRELGNKQSAPWVIQTLVATNYEDIAAQIQEFMRVLSEAETSFEAGDIDDLESVAEGMQKRIWGGTQGSAQQISSADPLSEGS